MEAARLEYQRDDRSDSFRMVGDTIAMIAENHGITIDDTTRRRWNDLLGLLREFDTLVDDQRMPAGEALLELYDFDRFKPHYLSLGPPEIDDETHCTMVRRVALILEHGEELRHATDVEAFLYHRREEVDHTAELLADCATSDVTTQAGFYTKFMPTLRTMGEAANYIDTLLDYRQDKKEQKIQIPFTPEFLRAVGTRAIMDFGRASHVLLGPGVIKEFYDMSLMRLKNRLKHGTTPYSSLKNIR